MSQYIVNPFYTFGNPPTETENSWIELNRTTLGGPADSISVIVPKKRFLMVLYHIIPNGSTNAFIRLNGDATANYTDRASSDGGGDVSQVSLTGMLNLLSGNRVTDYFGVFWIDNSPTGEKLAQGQVAFLTATTITPSVVTNAPSRVEVEGKWRNIADQITTISVVNTDAGDFDTGSEVIVLGWDPTDAQPPLANFWVPLTQVILSANADVIDTGVFATAKYLWVEVFLTDLSGTIDSKMTFNSDVGVSYARRGSQNGGADFTFTSLNSIIMSNIVAGRQRHTFHIVNHTTRQKLLTGMLLENMLAGAGSMGTRGEQVAKWINIVSQITRITINNAGTGDYGIGSMIKVWGHN